MALSKKKKILLGGGALALGGLAYGVYSLSKRHDSSKDTKPNEVTDEPSESTEGESTGTGTGSSDGKTKKKTVVEEIPITNYKEALEFANREWNKIKRDNGRTLECQVLGSTSWKCGEWCKVYLPSFDIDGYMYIIRTSQTSEGGDWTTNLSLVDYPPGWGQEEAEDTGEDSEEETDEENSEEEGEEGENTEEATT